jgi:hypothetical protein
VSCVVPFPIEIRPHVCAALESTCQYLINMAIGNVNAKTATDPREMAKNHSSRFMPMKP